MNQVVGSGKEAYKECQKNLLYPSGSYYVGSSFKGHFSVLWAGFRPDEEVKEYFPAVYIGGSSDFVKKDSGVACAITDKRFLLAQKLPLKTMEKTIQISTITNVDMTGKMLGDELTVMTNTESMVLRINKKIGRFVYETIQERIMESAASAATVAVAPVVIQQPVGAPSQLGAADEVRRLKALLDDGLISDEEFNTLKRKALGL